MRYVLELLRHTRADPALCPQVRLERRVVFLNELIKEGALRAVALYTRRTATRTGFPACRQADMIASLRSYPDGHRLHRSILLGLAPVVSPVSPTCSMALMRGAIAGKKRLRRSIGLKDGDYVPGLGWLRLVVNLAL